jgi:hypothetical protein
MGTAVVGILIVDEPRDAPRLIDIRRMISDIDGLQLTSATAG